MAAERVMPVGWRTYNERRKVVAEAQRLARSGQYADHTAILPLLQHMEGFEAARARLDERAMRAQIDKLCRMARDHDAKSPGRRA